MSRRVLVRVLVPALVVVVVVVAVVVVVVAAAAVVVVVLVVVVALHFDARFKSVQTTIESDEYHFLEYEPLRRCGAEVYYF